VAPGDGTPHNVPVGRYHFVYVSPNTVATTVNLSDFGPDYGDIVIVKGGAAAATYNVTVDAGSVTIDGAATQVISTNYGVLRCLWDGAAWLLF
jgi:uncharacterized protein with von Willebrand factor type A (vWA) domain